MFDITEKDLQDKETLANKLLELASLVYNRHYYASKKEKEDLISVGVLKALTLIEKGEWRKEKGLLFNYLYSGMRNEMHNYLYRNNREVCYKEFYDRSKYDSYFESEIFKINFNDIEEVCSCFSCYGRTENTVACNLKRMGFTVSEWVCDGSNCILLIDSMKHDLVSRLTSAVIWKTLANKAV